MVQGINPIATPHGAGPVLDAMQASQSIALRGATEENPTRTARPEQAILSLRPAFADKESINDTHAREALVARGADQVLRAAGEVLVEAKRDLEAIVKNYPPFPVDSAERQAYLRSVSGLRQQLAQMIIPPPPDSKPQVEPRFFPREDNRILQNVSINEDILPPQLDPANATDREVADALGKVEIALGSIEAFLARLARNVQDVAQEISNYQGGDDEVTLTSRQARGELLDTPQGIGGDVRALFR